MIDLPKLLCPPEFEQAIGYEGESRYVALYWTPDGDEIVYEDGRSAGTGDWQAWLLFSNHWKVSPFLMGALCPICQGTGCADCYEKGFVVSNFGDRHSEPDHWLLLDRHERRWSMGAVKEVQRLLVEHLPTLPLSKQEWGAVSTLLADEFSNVATLLEQDVRSVLRQRGAIERSHLMEMVQWLEAARPSACEEKRF
jgi:hypothetical protein